MKNLDQALFGYESGHHLLTSSITLPTSARQILAVATDLSGSAPAKGFDHAYTGIPLPETKHYALFCTWLAPEMRRPGCVWSHVLLIELADLAEIEDLGALRTLFRRPSKSSVSDYSKPLQLSRSSNGNEFDQRAYVIAEPLVRLLYSNAAIPIVVAATTENSYEDLIFRIWSQQWPRLRRNFRFSTGSFADRGRGGTPFDLQVTPRTNRRAWHGASEVQIVDEDSEENLRPNRSEDWVRKSVSDLFSETGTELRSFLFEHGPDVSSPRGGFKKLVQAYANIHKTPPDRWSDVLSLIAESFPSPKEALSLKRATLAQTEAPSSKAQLERQWQAIEYLCVHATNSAYSQVSLNVVSIIKNLWSRKRTDIVKVLTGRPSPTTQESWKIVARAVADTIDDSDLLWIAELHADLVPPLIQLRPNLAISRELWRMPERFQWRIIEALERGALPAETWSEIVAAMLEASMAVGAKQVVDAAGQGALDGAIRWIATTKKKYLPSVTWREALRLLAERRLESSSQSVLELLLCVALSSPESVQKLSLKRSDMKALTEVDLDSLPTPLQLPSAFFFVTMALQSSGPIAARLLGRGFFKAHEALADEVEPVESWRLLQPHLPVLWFWHQWDRCEMLRQGVRRWLADNHQCSTFFMQEAVTANQRALAHNLSVEG